MRPSNSFFQQANKKGNFSCQSPWSQL